MGIQDVLGMLFRRGVGASFSWRFWGTSRVNRWNFFQDSEVAGLDTELVAMLDLARGKAGIPFIITCGLRTQEQNDALPESVKDSAHLTGHAVDLHCGDSGSRFQMVQALLAAGFTRIGLYLNDGHIHVDNDASKPQEVIWISG